MQSNQKKILIVDDEPDMRIFLSVLCKTNGYFPIATKNGMEGIQKATDICPDLVILDVMMPGEGGVNMYRALRTNENLCRIPIMMLSAVGKQTFSHYLNMLNAQLENPIKAPDAYLEKPPEPKTVLSLIKSLIDN